VLQRAFQGHPAIEKFAGTVVFLTDKLKRAGNNARMNSPTTGLRVASIIFAIFAIGHLLRLIKHAQVIVGSHTIPMGVSWVALIVAAILCIWMWRLSSSRGI
jgi:Flp pilus assembly protein TadB